MLERLSRPDCHRLIAYIAFLVISPLGHAEIYKWVDANGKTQYSERREKAGTAKVEEIKLKLAPASTEDFISSATKVQQQEEKFRERQLKRDIEERERKIAFTPPNSSAGGRAAQRDAARCNLAIGILQGSMVRSDGTPTSADDRDTAKANIRSLCR